MTRQQLKTKFPNASPAFLNANADLFDNPPSRSNHQASQAGKEPSRGADTDSPVVEPSVSHGALDAARIQKGVSRNVLVRVTAMRKRLLDEDNLCEKYVVDLLRNAGIIFDDAPGETKIEVCQQKAAKGEAERVKVEVFQIV